MNLATLKKDVYFLTQSSSAIFSDEDLERSLNHHYDNVVTLIWRVAQDWWFDDKNYPDLPIAVKDLVDGQREYSLPTTARQILRVEVKDSSEKWRLLQPLDPREIKSALEEYLKTPAIPIKYTLMKNSLFLYPPPDANQVTTAGGLKIYLSRSVNPLSAPGDEPGFASEFHRLLSLGAAQDFCIAYEMPQREAYLRREKERLELELISFYSQRFRDRKIKFSPLRESYK